jgi:hypothetical protein
MENWFSRSARRSGFPAFETAVFRVHAGQLGAADACKSGEREDGEHFPIARLQQLLHFVGRVDFS